MSDDIESLLRAGLFEPPAGFTERVMTRIAQAPPPMRAPASRGLRQTLERIALVAAALFGAMQLAAFIFGIWSAASAG